MHYKTIHYIGYTSTINFDMSDCNSSLTQLATSVGARDMSSERDRFPGADVALGSRSAAGSGQHGKEI